MAPEERKPSPMELHPDLRELTQIASAAASALNNIVLYARDRERLDDSEAAHFTTAARNFRDALCMPLIKLVERERWAIPGNCLERLNDIAAGAMIGIDRATAIADCGLTDDDAVAVQQNWPIFRENLQQLELYPSNEFVLDLTAALKDAARRRETTVTSSSRSSTAGRATANQLMLDIMMKNPESRGWTAKQWGKQIKKSPSTIVATSTWKELALVRERTKAERRRDRHRR